jgi:WS/DGAT/MGAT family acyltransferase
MERLGPLDAVFVEAENEDRHTSMAIASVAVVEGPMPSYEEFVGAIESRLPLVPRYRQRMREVPFRLGPPVWVDSPDFDIRRHIKETALPAPGGDDELFAAMAQIMGSRLDRDHPLWEYWVIDGVAGGRWALVSKVHHCMVDGVSGTDLYRVMFDTGEVVDAGEASESTGTSKTDLIAGAARAALELPGEEAAVLARLARHPLQTGRGVADFLAGGRKLLIRIRERVSIGCRALLCPSRRVRLCPDLSSSSAPPAGTSASTTAPATRRHGSTAGTGATCYRPAVRCGSCGRSDRSTSRT